MGVSMLAARAQVSGGYAVDKWIELRLEPMTKLWQGDGGRSDFFFSEEDARDARGAYTDSTPYRFAETLWRMAQVSPSAKLGFRREIVEFVVNVPVPAAVGICRANIVHGFGSVLQYYVPNWDHSLFRTGRRHRFSQVAY